MDPSPRKTRSPSRTPKRANRVDVIIIGGGPAGLSAALVLGRCRRSVLLFDRGTPRNHASTALHGFLTRDGTHPRELTRLARAELERYDTVRVCDIEVLDAIVRDGDFEVIDANGARHTSRRLVLATGIEDELPNIAGFDTFYGRGIHHCPYCDGWEVRDQPLVALARGEQGVGLAEELTVWSHHVTLCTSGVRVSADQRARLDRSRIAVREEPVARFEGSNTLERVVFEDGSAVLVKALFFGGAQRQQSHIAEKLGCEVNEEGVVPCGEAGETSVKGLYIVGDASRRLPLHFAIAAAAEGAEAATGINQALLEEDLSRL